MISGMSSSSRSAARSGTYRPTFTYDRCSSMDKGEELKSSQNWAGKKSCKSNKFFCLQKPAFVKIDENERLHGAEPSRNQIRKTND